MPQSRAGTACGKKHLHPPGCFWVAEPICGATAATPGCFQALPAGSLGSAPWWMWIAVIWRALWSLVSNLSRDGQREPIKLTEQDMRQQFSGTSTAVHIYSGVRCAILAAYLFTCFFSFTGLA